MYRNASQIWLWFKPTLPWLLIGVLTSCGYTLSHRLRPAFQTSRGFFVPVMTNATEETGAERIFTNALIRELESHGNLVMNHFGDDALELRGTISSISYAPSVFSEFGFGGLQGYRRIPMELGLNVSLSLALVDPQTNQVLWSGGFSGFRRVETPLNRTYDFEATSSLSYFTQSLVESRYHDVARDIMRDIYDDMVEFFPPDAPKPGVVKPDGRKTVTP